MSAGFATITSQLTVSLGSDDFTLQIGVEGKLGKYEGHKGQWLLSSSLYLSLPRNSLL